MAFIFSIFIYSSLYLSTVKETFTLHFFSDYALYIKPSNNFPYSKYLHSFVKAYFRIKAG
ncbi:MAG: hypothetical protein OHK0057_12590 [Thermoflexibacter sp.]